MYMICDNMLALDVGSMPSNNDWLSVESFVVFLKTYYEITIGFSGLL